VTIIDISMSIMRKKRYRADIGYSLVWAVAFILGKEIKRKFSELASWRLAAKVEIIKILYICISKC